MATVHKFAKDPIPRNKRRSRGWILHITAHGGGYNREDCTKCGCLKPAAGGTAPSSLYDGTAGRGYRKRVIASTLGGLRPNQRDDTASALRGVGFILKTSSTKRHLSWMSGFGLTARW